MKTILENSLPIFSLNPSNKSDSSNEIKRRKAQAIDRRFVCNYKNC